MKTIKTLKTLINILFFTLIGAAILQVLFWFIVYFFSDSLPIFLQGFKIVFSSFLNWKMFLIPLITALNFVLFIITVSYLRKSVSSFIQSDFYSKEVIKNLNKAGTILVFIGVSTILIQIFSIVYIQNIVQIKINVFIKFLNVIIGSIDLKSTFSIIIGLFFMLFSKVIENSRTLKQENDLTI